MRTTIATVALVIALLVFRPSPSLSQQGDCSAQVTVTQTARQPDAYGATFKYRINATSDAPSAVVHFKLARTFDVNGSPYSQAEPWSVIVRGGQGSDDGEVRESSSPRQIQWSVRDVFCRRTSTGGQASTGAQTTPKGQESIGQSPCDLTGTWAVKSSRDDGASKSDPDVQLTSQGAQITGHGSGFTISGTRRDDGTVEWMNGSGPWSSKITAKIDDSCTRIEGRWA